MKPQKLCKACGRPMTYRKKWANDWDEVKYCSKSCRGNGSPEALMNRIRSLLAQRGPGKSICPSEVLEVSNKQSPRCMERVRDAARLLAHEGHITITQRGKVVDPSNFKGPIRLRRSTATTTNR